MKDVELSFDKFIQLFSTLAVAELDYSLWISKKRFCRLAEVLDCIEDLTGPIMTVTEDSLNAKLLFSLEETDDTTDMLARIFERLDQDKERLRISGFALAETTVEDMLLLLNHVSEHISLSFLN